MQSGEYWSVTGKRLVSYLEKIGQLLGEDWSVTDRRLSLWNLTSALQSEGAASAKPTHSQIQNPVLNVNTG